MNIYFLDHKKFLKNDLTLTDTKDFKNNFKIKIINKDYYFLENNNNEFISVNNNDNSLFLTDNPLEKNCFKYSKQKLFTKVNNLIYFLNLEDDKLILSEQKTEIQFIEVYEHLIDDYFIIDILGEGSYGKVYKAENSKTYKKVVIKKIEITKFDSEEIKIMKFLSDKLEKFSIKLIDTYTKNNFKYIVMEYLNNYITLDEFLDENSNLENNIIDTIIYNIYKVIIEIHDLDISHNDLKPANIMINKYNYNIKFIDYGFSSIKKCNKIKGYTVRYADPNMLKRHMNFEPDNLYLAKQSDLWSIGIIIYKILLKKTPYELYYKSEDKCGSITSKIIKKKYANNYDFFKDKNRNKIFKKLKEINENLNIDNLLTRHEHRKIIY